MIPIVRIARAAMMVVPLLGICATASAGESAAVPPLPEHLSQTGLFLPGSNTVVDPKNLAFSPQYPLWSDGARKRRWIYLPPGTAIDASRADAWEFPRGTRLWKEFSHARVIETRFIERLSSGEWRFAAYVWNEAGTDATLASSEGVTIARHDAPNGHYVVPAEADCRACHEGAAAPVLGFSALQLSSDRDPLAVHAETAALDLRSLLARGLIRNLPDAMIAAPPRIAASTPTERAALGYLHGNCAHCHNDNGEPAPVDLTLAQSATSGAAGTDRILHTMIDARSRFRGHGLPADAPLIAPGEPNRSVLVARVRSRNPQTQMPPLGTQMPDEQAVALLERWITERSHTSREAQK